MMCLASWAENSYAARVPCEVKIFPDRQDQYEGPPSGVGTDSKNLKESKNGMKTIPVHIVTRMDLAVHVAVNTADNDNVLADNRETQKKKQKRMLKLNQEKQKLWLVSC